MIVSAYESYRESCIVWLGDVPSHWSVQKLKHFVDDAFPITYGIVQAGPHILDGIPYIRPTDMSDEAGVLSPDELMRTSAQIAEEYSRSKVSTGNLIVSIGPSFGKAMVAPAALDGCNLTQGTARVAVSSNHVPKFVFWALRCSTSFAQWESSVGGATFRALNLKPLAETILPAPPLSEQAAIAAFLDRETAKIDALVEVQKRLIELLKEKRQAVISHAVTKGLDPNAPMKDSGIEWLGKVPSHWNVKRLKHLGSFKAGSGFPHEEQGIEGEALDFHKVNALAQADDDGFLEPSDNTISFDTARRLGAFVFPEGAIVFAKIGAALLLGRVRRLQREACLDNNLMGFLVEDGNPNFVRHMMTLIRFDYIANPGTVPSLNEPQIANVQIALPPEADQAEIAQYLDDTTARFDTLISEANAGISLLQERRSALISAAVTGKIDVRGVASAEAEAA